MKAISSMATRSVLAELAEGAAQAGLPSLHVVSVGGVDAARRVEDGDEVDLVFLAQEALRALAAHGRVDAATLTPLFVSQVAVAGASGSPAPASPTGAIAFEDEGALRDALRGARSIGYSTGPSGSALVAMITGWGLLDELDGRLIQARPGVPVAKLLADGEVEIGLQQLSELVGQPGIEIRGVLPPDCAIETIFAGAVATVSGEPSSAKDVLAFLASDVAAPVIARHHFTPPSR